MALNRENTRRIRIFFFFLCLTVLVGITTAFPQVRRIKGQVVYVPVYSHIYYGDRENYFLLSSTLSIRNTDFNQPMVLGTLEYFNTEGVLLEKMISTPVTIKPLETVRFVIKESDTRGGSGAKFIVRWHSVRPVNEPIIEAVMIGTRNQQGISFTSRGVVITETR